MKKILLIAMMVFMFLGFSINVKAEENNVDKAYCFKYLYKDFDNIGAGVDASFSINDGYSISGYLINSSEYSDNYVIRFYDNQKGSLLNPSYNNRAIKAIIYSYMWGRDFNIKDNIVYDWIPSIVIPMEFRHYRNSVEEIFPNFPIFGTEEQMMNYFENGSTEGEIFPEEELDESLVIKGLQYETVSSFLKGKKTIFSWTIASAFENDTKLDIEFEVDGELISGGTLKIPFKRIKPYENNFFSDKDGTYEFYNNTVIPAAQKSIPNYSPNVLDKINILNYYCRYRRTNANGTFTYGPWQRIGDDIPEIEDLDKAIYDETLDLKHIGILFTTPNVQAILEGDTQKLMWKSLNPVSNAYLRVEANCRYYDKVTFEVGTPNNSKPIFTKYIDSSCLLYDSNNKLLTVKKQELIREDYLRQRFCSQNNVFVDGYSCVAKEYYITNYAIIDGELKRSRCYKVDVINVANGRVTGKGYSGTIDSDSSHFIEDTSDPNFERDKIISKEDEDGNSVLVKDPDIDDTFFPPKPPTPSNPDDPNSSDIPILNLETISKLFYNVGQFFLWTINSLTNLVSLVGRLPYLFSQVFSFLPNMVTQSMGVTIIVSFIFRIIGR